MPRRETPWPAGSPCWADNHVPDVEAAQAFYGSIVGWRIDDPDPSAGGFAAARLDGRPVAGFLVGVDAARPEWHVYLATDDVEATAAAVARAGGTGLFGPQRVPPDRGRFQLVADPTGAVLGAWEAASLTGATVYGEPGALSAPDLLSPDPLAAQAFYAEVFGLTAGTTSAGSTPLLLPGPEAAEVGRLRPLPVAEPGDQEAGRWVTVVSVADLDEALSAVSTGGGRVLDPAYDGSTGRAAIVADPFAATFALVEPAAARAQP